MNKERLPETSGEKWARRSRNGGLIVAGGGLLLGSSGLVMGGAAGAVIFEAIRGNARAKRENK